MSSSQALFRGRVQAQGKDIEQDGGYSKSWAQNVPVTDSEGLEFLAIIEAQCSKSQQEQRKQAFSRAKRFVKNAGSCGISPEAQPHSFQDRRRTVPDARVDIEITSGQTFVTKSKEAIK